MNTSFIINKLLAILINHDPYYPWYRYIYHTYQKDYTEFANLELEIMLANETKNILVLINTDDELLEFSPKEFYKDQEIQEANPETYTIQGITFYLIFD